MKCIYCKMELPQPAPGQSAVRFCPYCGKTQEPTAPKTPESVLRDIETQFGEAALQDKGRLVSFFSDLAPELKREKNLLKCFAECDGNTRLLDVRNRSAADQQVAVEQTIQQMQNHFFIDRTAAQTICAAYLRALHPAETPAAESVCEPVVPIAPATPVEPVAPAAPVAATVVQTAAAPVEVPVAEAAHEPVAVPTAEAPEAAAPAAPAEACSPAAPTEAPAVEAPAPAAPVKRPAAPVRRPVTQTPPPAKPKSGKGKWIAAACLVAVLAASRLLPGPDEPATPQATANPPASLPEQSIAPDKQLPTGTAVSYVPYLEDGISLPQPQTPAVRIELSNTTFIPTYNEYNDQNQLIRQVQYPTDYYNLQCILYEYDAQGRESKRTCYLRTEELWSVSTEYDENGRIHREAAHGVNEAPTYTLYAYDRQGRIAEKSTYNLESTLLESRNVYTYPDGDTYQVDRYDTKDRLDSIHTYHNGDDRLLSYEFHPENGAVETTVYEYDEQGKRVGSVTYDPAGNTKRRYEYTYNSEGYVTVSACYNANGQLDYKILYDDLGVELSMEGYDHGEFTWRTENSYAPEGYLETSVLFDPDDEPSSTSTYNSKRQMVSEAFYLKDESGSSYIYSTDYHEYDADGKRTCSKSYNQNGELETVRYYDDMQDTWYFVTREEHYQTSESENPGALRDINLYEYDTQSGNRTRWTKLDAAGNTEFIECYSAFTADGKTGKVERYNGDGVLESYTVSEFDNNGNRVKESRYDAQGNLQRYTAYQYDSAGEFVDMKSYNADGTPLH